MVVNAATPVQEDWVPGNFFVTCEPEQACDLKEEDRYKVADMLSEAVDIYRKLPFYAPRDWGKRVGSDSVNDYIEVYQRGPDKLAEAAARCGETGDRDYSRLLVGTSWKKDTYFRGRDYLLFYFMAHEIFHLSQYGYPFFDQELCKYAIPGWIKESMATAVGLDVMRRAYPDVWPSLRDAREARQFAGLRRYDQPLPVVELDYRDDMNILMSGAPIYYYTSSFWRHLADTYHNGSFNYLSRYMKQLGRIGNWIPWLRSNIEDDVGMDLGLVFAGFVTDYAGWGDSPFAGQFFGSREWLKGAFGGCQQVLLNPQEPAGWADVKLKPLSGRCVEVRVPALGDSGLAPGDAVAVQVAATLEKGDKEDRDGLHLGLAFANDNPGFHCSREAKRLGLLGIGRCLLVPDDGKIRLDGGETDARVWTVKPQQWHADGASRAGELVNRYIVSFTPADFSEAEVTIYDEREITARLYFVMNRTRATGVADSSTANSGAPKRTVASLQPVRQSDPQTTLPKQDAMGRPANSYTLPSMLRPDVPAPVMAVPPEALGKLSTLTVYVESWEGRLTREEQASLVLTPVAQSGEGYDARPLQPGDTGAFEVGLHGNLGGVALVGTGLGSLQVQEFTDLAFRATYSGSLCRITDVRPKQTCARPIPVSGEIVKGFPGSRLIGHYMQIEDTPGARIYREAAERFMSGYAQDLAEEPDPAATESGQADPSGSTGGQVADCDCSCDERDATLREAEALKARVDAGEDVGMASLTALTRCSDDCRREYMICEMEADRAAAAADAERAGPASDPAACDCSCAGLQDLERRSRNLQEAVNSGREMDAGALEQLGTCLNTCISEYSACRMR